MNQIEVEFVKYEFAKLSFMECAEYLDLYEKGLPLFTNKPFAFKRAISKSFVITYARPFTNNNSVDGKGVGTISTKWVKTLPGAQRKLHELLIGEGRNSLVAHIDISKLKPNVWVKEGAHNDYVFDWVLPMISENNLADLRELVSTAYKFCHEHQQKIKTKLGTCHIIPRA
jgi:hypothetical protein